MKWLASLVCALLLSSCAAQQKVESAEANAQVGIVNHTGKYIYTASIDGAGGGRMSAWGAGIANICCTSIPRVWYPGMKVLVRWNMPEGVKDVVKEKIVEVENYERPRSIYLHFFPNDEVRVVITSLDPTHPDHPIPPPVKPGTSTPAE